MSTLLEPLHLGRGRSDAVETPQEVQEVRGRMGFGHPAQAGAEILLGSLEDRRFKVKKPLVVRFGRDEDQTLAEAVGFDEFGTGQNRSEALEDLQRSLAVLFVELVAQRRELGPDLTRVLEQLEAHLDFEDRVA